MAGRRMRCKVCGATFLLPAEPTDDTPFERATDAEPEQGYKSRRGRSLLDEDPIDVAPPATKPAAKPVQRRPVPHKHQRPTPEIAPPMGDELAADVPSVDAVFESAFADFSRTQSSKAFVFPGSAMLDRWLPIGLVTICIAWLAYLTLSGGAPAANDPGAPAWVGPLRLAALLITYTGVVLPICFFGVKKAAEKLHFDLPPHAAWRAFATFLLPITIGCAAWLSRGSVGGFAIGASLGLIVALPTLWLLFRIRGEHAAVSLGHSTAAYGAGVLAAAIVLSIVNLTVAGVVHATGAQHTLSISPFGPGFYWRPASAPTRALAEVLATSPQPTAPKPKPAAVVPRPAVEPVRESVPESAPEVADDPKTVPPPAATKPAVAEAPVAEAPVVEAPVAPITRPPTTRIAAAAKEAAAARSALFPEIAEEFAKDAAADSSAADASAKDVPTKDMPAKDAPASDTPANATDDTAAVAKNDPREDPVKDAAQGPANDPAKEPESESIIAESKTRLTTDADAILRPLLPSRVAAIVKPASRADEDQIELWTIGEAKPTRRKSFSRSTQGTDDYRLSTDGNLLARLADFPSLSVQVFSFAADSTLQPYIKLDPAAPKPYLAGFVLENRLLTFAGAVGAGKPAAEVWDVNTAKRLRKIEVAGLRPEPTSFAVDAGGKRLALLIRDATTGHGRLDVYDLSTGQSTRRIEIDELQWNDGVKPAGVSFSEEGDKVAVLFTHQGGAGLFLCWGAKDGIPIHQHLYPGGLLPDEVDPAAFRGPAFTLLDQGRAWMVYGATVFDSTTGRELGRTGLKGVISQNAAGPQSVLVVRRNVDKDAAGQPAKPNSKSLVEARLDIDRARRDAAGTK